MKGKGYLVSTMCQFDGCDTSEVVFVISDGDTLSNIKDVLLKILSKNQYYEEDLKDDCFKDEWECIQDLLNDAEVVKDSISKAISIDCLIGLSMAGYDVACIKEVEVYE